MKRYYNCIFNKNCKHADSSSDEGDDDCGDRCGRCGSARFSGKGSGSKGSKGGKTGKFDGGSGMEGDIGMKGGGKGANLDQLKGEGKGMHGNSEPQEFPWRGGVPTTPRREGEGMPCGNSEPEGKGMPRCSSEPA